MHAVPSLLRQLFRSSSLHVVKSSSTSPSTRSLSYSSLGSPVRTRALWRSAFVCPRCEIRATYRPYSQGSKNEGDRLEGKVKDEKTPAEQPQSAETSNTIRLGPPPEDTATAPPPPPPTPPGLEDARTEDGKHETRHESAEAEHLRHDLPSSAESRRSQLSKQFTHIMDNLQGNIFIAGQRLNDLTGYSAIEALKRDIEEQESLVRSTRAAVRAAKTAYQDAVNLRSSSQREVNELLQRKHIWSPTDLERFTSLYRSDHANEQMEFAAQEALVRTEREAEEAAAKLSRSILSRYHEEQVWSDKIRRMSTWGTWGLMGVNVLLFLVFQVLVEPWRRRRLVTGFEEKVREALEKEKALMVAIPTAAAAAAVGSTSAETNIPQEAEKIASGSGASPDSAEIDADPAILAAVDEAIPGPLDASEEDVYETPSDQPDLIPATNDQTSTASIESETEAESPLSPLPPPQPLPNLLHTLSTFNTSELKSLSTHYSNRIQDLFSDERHVTISQKDLTTVALESAVAGAAVVWFVVVLVGGGKP